jgi:hypothetical protein
MKTESSQFNVLGRFLFGRRINTAWINWLYLFPAAVLCGVVVLFRSFWCKLSPENLFVCTDKDNFSKRSQRFFAFFAVHLPAHPHHPCINPRRTACSIVWPFEKVHNSLFLFLKPSFVNDTFSLCT